MIPDLITDFVPNLRHTLDFLISDVPVLNSASRRTIFTRTPHSQEPPYSVQPYHCISHEICRTFGTKSQFAVSAASKELVPPPQSYGTVCLYHP